MSTSDVKMEDAEKLPNDSGNNDTKVEREGEKSPSAAAVSEYVSNVDNEVSNVENEGEDINKCRKEDEDKTKIKIESKDQTNPNSEACEPAEGSISEKINSESGNGELISTKTRTEEQSASISAAEKQTDAGKEVFDQNVTNGGVKEEKSTENEIKGGNHVKNVEEEPKEDVAEKMPEESEATDFAEPVAGGEKTIENGGAEDVPIVNKQLPTEISATEAPQSQSVALNEVQQGEDEDMADAADARKDKPFKDDVEEQGKETVLTSSGTDGNNKTVPVAAKHDGQDSAPTVPVAAKHDGQDSAPTNQHEAATPNSLVRHSPSRAGDHSGETVKNVFTQAMLPPIGESDDGTPDDQAAFMKEIESFYRERAMDFKPPKFYGQPLNCLKLWRAVIRLGGYDRVTGSKLWRQVGESFHPPKTCTTVSWTFRIFYEKSLLEYERHKTQSGELQLPVPAPPEASGVDGDGNGYQRVGSGKNKTARATQGWHVQNLFANGEVGEPLIKDKNLNITEKREKSLKSIGSVKQKRSNDVEHSNKAARIETSKQLVTSIVDVGPPADWVKINVRQTKDCFEIYALVPGLLREEVRVQSDPAGRVVITGQPEQSDNPWGITAFKKVVSLPARIDPLQTSAVVSLHGRLLVRVPFEQSNN